MSYMFPPRKKNTCFLEGKKKVLTFPFTNCTVSLIA